MTSSGSLQATGTASRRGTVLVVGVVLTEMENTAQHVVDELGRSSQWAVDQRWMAVGSGPLPTGRGAFACQRTGTGAPKFTLLNECLSGTPAATAYDYLLVVDDDVLLSRGFLDEYLAYVVRHDLALCQPARSHDSFIDHPFVEQLDGIVARRTRFVEIGPLFSLRADAAALVLPFDLSSPMGWGYDTVWPVLLEPHGLKLGIVDAVPVAHAIRPPTSHYSHPLADAQRSAYLRRHHHLPEDEAFQVLESYA